MAKSQTPLDLLALFTLWIVVVPPSEFGTAGHASTIALIVRVSLSVVYGIDVVIRGWRRTTGATSERILSACSSWRSHRCASCSASV